MSTLLCTVDHTSSAAEAAEAAIARCEPGSELVLVGVVEPQSEAPAPAFGERIRRFGLVEKNLVRAARAVRAAGLTPTVVLRHGERSAETLAVAAEVGADEILFVERRGFLGRRSEVVLVNRTLTERPARLSLVAA
jgi:threonine dehydrogenase-like Zn-dependent dehydrogenase